jgi:Domain of unknown function (DUF6378)
MNPHAVLDEAKNIIGERGADYGGIERNFQRIAEIYNLAVDGNIDAYEVAMLMVCLKLARTRECPKKRDNYIDMINYAAFACELVGAK